MSACSKDGSDTDYSRVDMLESSNDTDPTPRSTMMSSAAAIPTTFNEEQTRPNSSVCVKRKIPCAESSARSSEGSAGKESKGAATTAPATKVSNPSPKKKSRLDQFFAPKKPKAKPTIEASSEKQDETKGDDHSKSKKNDPFRFTCDENGIPLPIVPSRVPPPNRVLWSIVENGAVMIRKDRNGYGKKKAAAIDMDGTLLLWKASFFPNKINQYELWNSEVITKLRQLSDDGYQLIVISNQGGIRKATSGKTVQKVQALLDWLAFMLQRPLWAVLSTQSQSGFHKPDPRLWSLVEKAYGKSFGIEHSLYVGDSDGSDTGDEYQAKGVDKAFAENVSNMKGKVLTFSHPLSFFGPSSMDRRLAMARSGLTQYTPPSDAALTTFAALYGGYLKGPICLMLCGAQGSGKSTFGEILLRSASKDSWVVLSQDTIRDGKPGKREDVESAAGEALREQKSVVIDRMHLNVDQRQHFVNMARQRKVPVHSLVLSPPKSVVLERVKKRTNHPAKVEGDKGAKLARASIEGLVIPDYEEGFDLVSIARTAAVANDIAVRYAKIGPSGIAPPRPVSFRDERIPQVVLGTMKLGKRVLPSTILSAQTLGVNAVDTAPTYNNELEIGNSLNDNSFVIAKVPKRAVQPEEVRKEFMSSLKRLKRIDLLLLHWPCDVIENDTLTSVWKEMEKLVDEGHCKMLGVSNFSVDAIRTLLPLCRIRPVVNQVECHPLFPQWDLMQFCSDQAICIQAHTPLGQGCSELLDHQTVQEVASELKVPPARIVLQWNLQHGVSVVPKCSSSEHLEDVTRISDGLSACHMKKLDEMCCDAKRFVRAPFMNKKGAVYSW